jgi:hypothetical protein
MSAKLRSTKQEDISAKLKSIKQDIKLENKKEKEQGTVR